MEDWAKVISNMKFREQRIFNKDDKERQRPYKFNHYATDFITGEVSISIYSIKDSMNYTMSADYFLEFFEVIEVEY